MLRNPQKQLLRAVGHMALICFFLSVTLLQTSVFGQEKGSEDVILDLRPKMAGSQELPAVTPEDYDPQEPALEPFYQNPWFWIAIAVTAGAAGATVYMMTQQEPHATLIMDQ